MPYNVPRHTGLAAHPALERARASAIKAAARRTAKLLEQQGRGGDRHLVHVNDRELAAIRGAFGPGGGAGRCNPVTGLESFAPDDEAADTGAAFVGMGPDGSGYTMRLPLDTAPTDDSVVRSDGQTLFIPDENGEVTILRSPKADLSDVVAAGRATRQGFTELMDLGQPESAIGYALGGLFRDVGPGGTFDYQRTGSSQTEGLLAELPSSQFKKFDQRRDYQPVANFNVGLYAQQAGLSLEDTLRIAGLYAGSMSMVDRNRRPDLTRVGRHYMTQGWLAGDRGNFDPAGGPQESGP